MNRILIISFFFLLFTVIILGAFTINLPKILQNISKTSTLDWKIIKKKILSNCKTNRELNKKEQYELFTKLFKKTGEKVIYDRMNEDFYPPVGKGAYTLDINSINGQTCWIAFVGDFKGQGIVSYESIDGNLKTYEVKKFPSPFNID